MAFTQDQLDSLDKAIASGELRWRYQDREVTYRSLDEMMRIRDRMAAEISGTEGGGIVTQKLGFSKGLC